MNELEKVKIIQELNKLSLHELKAYIFVCTNTFIKKIAVKLYQSKVHQDNAMKTQERIQYFKSKISKYY